jgi:hypothetical protein
VVPETTTPTGSTLTVRLYLRCRPDNNTERLNLPPLLNGRCVRLSRNDLGSARPLAAAAG